MSTRALKMAAPKQPGHILLRDSFDLLRRKWGEVPATALDRIS